MNIFGEVIGGILGAIVNLPGAVMSFFSATIRALMRGRIGEAIKNGLLEIAVEVVAEIDGITDEALEKLQAQVHFTLDDVKRKIAASKIRDRVSLAEADTPDHAINWALETAVGTLRDQDAKLPDEK